MKEDGDVTLASEGWSVVQGKGQRPEECRWPPGAEKMQENGFAPRAYRKNQPSPHLDFSLVKLEF